MSQERSVPKTPRLVLENIYAFPPNRDTLGGTAYFIVENQMNILIDAPLWNETNQQFLEQQGGVQGLFITHRGAIGSSREIQNRWGCKIVIQEQEAYLLPESTVTTFEKELRLSSQSSVFWTPGHSPGSSCLYFSGQVGVLFTGRHLLPNLQGQPVPLRTAKTFHWPRQLNSIRFILERFNCDTLHYICPGANTGALRGERLINHAYEKLASLDLDACLLSPAIL
ncbi:Beta-lactamase domain protein [Planktothrix tepida]|uniref:Beta-lactamase domain protein n=2 Tax=Planktothrix TaxID=54304 RepID=A0A1J1LEC0_9CYAN|nr:MULTISPECIES: MBL fold metallo-hydrolase [Planktothrix]CAD5918607.1 Beta-lactamase domain protein [Planktothrix tepida]CAD5984543.1 Beta-lactamase domain protein [Planktothrix pseudagardhii]CUR30800.1 Beta-lactamase domain protein [Planktothrix tepida PCC 9214]